MKLRTKKIVAKRFKITKTGKIMRRKQNARHLRSHKSGHQLKRLIKNAGVSIGLQHVIKSYLAYNK